MSHTLSSTPTLHAFGAIAAKLTGPRERGPDRRVRRGCIDESEIAAQPWAKNRFSSTAERIATTESLVSIAKQLQEKHADAFPRGLLLELQTAEEALTAELDAVERRAPADRRAGDAAPIRIKLDEVRALLAEHAIGITRTDVDVLEALFGFLDFAGSGRWFPSWEKIAEAARCCEKSVARALKRLEHHGLVSWISRSKVAARRSDPGQRQRVQTSHAYFLDLKKRMAANVYQRFLQLREKRLRRLAGGKAPSTAAMPPAPPPPPSRDVAEQRSAIDRLGAALFGSVGHAG